jgi:dTDP-4-dehydrorhamnose reductase
MHILIIGSRGNLGGVLVDVYSDYTVTAWDTDEIDITNADMVREKITALHPDVVYNCAAYNAVDKAETEVEVANKVNGYAVGYLAEVCRAIDAIFVHFSTNYVFDGTAREAYTEDTLPSPESAYARSKVLGEQELQRIGGKAYLIRTSLLYGGKKTGGKKSFVDVMLEQAMIKSELQVVNDEYGNPTLVTDLAVAVKTVLDEVYP